MAMVYLTLRLTPNKCPGLSVPGCSCRNAYEIPQEPDLNNRYWYIMGMGMEPCDRSSLRGWNSNKMGDSSVLKTFFYFASTARLLILLLLLYRAVRRTVMVMVKASG